jgi:hypothetical protein
LKRKIWLNFEKEIATLDLKVKRPEDEATYKAQVGRLISEWHGLAVLLCQTQAKLDLLHEAWTRQDGPRFVSTDTVEKCFKCGAKTAWIFYNGNDRKGPRCKPSCLIVQATKDKVSVETLKMFDEIEKA